MRTMLLVNCKPELKKMLMVFGINCIEVEKKQQNQTLGFLLKKENYQPIETICSKPFSDEMIVFSDFDETQLDQVLALLKSTGQNIALKAIVTEHNINWPLCLLHDELAKEHAAFASIKKENK